MTNLPRPFCKVRGVQRITRNGTFGRLYFDRPEPVITKFASFRLHCLHNQDPAPVGPHKYHNLQPRHDPSGSMTSPAFISLRLPPNASYPSAGNRCTPGAAIGLDHVTINADLPLASATRSTPARKIDRSSVNFLCSTALSPCGFTSAAGVGCLQHSVFGSHPTHPEFLRRWHTLLN